MNKEIIKRLVAVRKLIEREDEKFHKKVDELKVERDTLQAQVIQNFKDEGQFSARYEFATVSLSVRKTPKVTDEKAVIKSLKKAGLENEYLETRPNDLFYDILPDLIKENTIDGVSITETEFLSVRKPSDKDEKRKVVTD